MGFRRLFYISHRDKNKNASTNTLLPGSSNRSVLSPVQPTHSTNPKNITHLGPLAQESRPQNLWLVAYKRLDNKKRKVLAATETPTSPIPNNGDTHFTADVLIDKVIRLTEE